MTPRKFIFLLGRPGSGKSDVYRLLGTRLAKGDALPTKIDDFPKLEALAKEDDQAAASGKPRRFTKNGAGWLANQVAYEEVLRRIDEELRNQPANAGEFVFVEFARSDMVRSIDENFSTAIRDQTFLIYVHCPIRICLERNRKRATATARGKDDHEVPEQRMIQRYGIDDLDRLHELGIPYVVIDNHLNTKDHLDLEIDKCLRVLGSTGEPRASAVRV